MDAQDYSAEVLVDYYAMPGMERPCRAEITARLPTVLEDNEYILSPLLVSGDEEVWGHALGLRAGALVDRRRCIRTFVSANTWEEVEQGVGRVVSELETTLKKVVERNAAVVYGKPEPKTLHVDLSPKNRKIKRERERSKMSEWSQKPETPEEWDRWAEQVVADSQRAVERQKQSRQRAARDSDPGDSYRWDGKIGPYTHGEDSWRNLGDAIQQAGLDGNPINPPSPVVFALGAAFLIFLFCFALTGIESFMMDAGVVERPENCIYQPSLPQCITPKAGATVPTPKPQATPTPLAYTSPIPITRLPTNRVGQVGQVRQIGQVGQASQASHVSQAIQSVQTIQVSRASVTAPTDTDNTELRLVSNLWTKDFAN